MSYPRETKEFQPIRVKVKTNGVEVKIMNGVEFAVIPSGTRPMAWVEPITLDGELGVMVNALAPGTWLVWARITSLPEIPVIYCGDFKVT